MKRKLPRTRLPGARRATQRFLRRATVYHQRVLVDLALLGTLTFAMGCLWYTVGRWIALGMILMLAPKLFTDAGRLLDTELLRDRLGMDPPPRGRHSGPRSAPIHTGAHPRPGARNKA